MDYSQAGQVNRVGSAIGSPAPDYAHANKPKEIGILPRIDGLRSGLQELRGSLESFLDRLEGAGASASANVASVSASLAGTVADAENELRTIRQLMQSLHDRF